MKRIYLYLLLSCLCHCMFSQYAIIPYPNEVIPGEGEYKIKSNISLSLPARFKSESHIIRQNFKDRFHVNCKDSRNGNIIVSYDKDIAVEGYQMEVGQTSINISASTKSGVFYALQTMFQLMRLSGDGSYIVPSLKINDKQAFSWRGFMHDDSRQFRGKEFIKQTLDEMAILKMNIFHWHLTDDNGWRVEIKKYPLLTEIGAWRDSTHIKDPATGMSWNSPCFDPNPHGGYYTQDDIKEIVDYATERHITVIPEIEMPAHTQAAIAAYPWLGIIGTEDKVRCSVGKTDAALDITNSKVYEFIFDVLDETMNLFPSKVIHIGGDEVNFDLWKNDEKISKWVEENGYNGFAAAQVDFTNKISQYIEKKGRRMMGWNEILGESVHDYHKEQDSNVKLSGSSVIHFWQGNVSMIRKAVENGYSVVNAHSFYAYLDYENTSLEKCYGFNPIPEGINDEYSKYRSEEHTSELQSH